MIKIISGYTGKGGSTVALINLCNYFNENGYECILYGDQEYHIDKCKSGKLNDVKYNENDILITHYLQLDSRPNVKKVILTSHEKWWFKVGCINKYWDTVVFLHEAHKEYHKEYKGESVIIPNLKENLIISNNKPENIAGIIGTIEDRKQTHISIQRALKDKCKKIYLFGHIGEQNYYNSKVKPYISEKVVHFGHTTNKQEMYNMIDRVYHSSKGEVACLVKDECYLTGTKFFGNDETANEVSKLNNNEILNLWLKLFN